MKLGILNEHEISFVIRDIDFPGNVKEEFKSPSAAKDYLRSMPFGLKNYYEIYDVRKGIILT